MSGHTVLITGAGFSKLAGGPLQRDLLAPESLERSAADSEALDVLAQLQADRQSLENPTETLETLFTSILREARIRGSISTSTGERWPAARLLDELRTHLASVCRELPIRRRARIWNTYAGYLRWLRKESRTLTVVTFNYDLLLERMFDDIRVRFGYGRSTGIELDSPSRRRTLRRILASSRVELLKLHGSANWGVCRGCRKATTHIDMVVAFEKAFVPIRRKRCPRCNDKWLESGIVPPILEKSSEGRYTELVWGAARAALHRAREIVVIGYSLPRSDLDAISLLREIVSPPLHPRITLICGPNGASERFDPVLPIRSLDTKQYFEDYVASIL